MMVVLATKLALLQVLILEQTYNNEAFGSWWFSYKKNDLKYRVVFDGRDRLLSVDKQINNDWKLQGYVTSQSEFTIVEEVQTIIQKYSN